MDAFLFLKAKGRHLPIQALALKMPSMPSATAASLASVQTYDAAAIPTKVSAPAEPTPSTSSMPLPTPDIAPEASPTSDASSRIKTLEEIVLRLNQKLRFLKRAHDGSRQELADAKAKTAALESKLAHLEAKAAETCDVMDQRLNSVHAMAQSVTDKMDKTAHGRDLALKHVESSLSARIDVITATVDGKTVAMKRLETQLQEQTSIALMRHKDLVFKMNVLDEIVSSATEKQERMRASLNRDVLYYYERANADHQKSQDLVTQMERLTLAERRLVSRSVPMPKPRLRCSPELGTEFRDRLEAYDALHGPRATATPAFMSTLVAKCE